MRDLVAKMDLRDAFPDAVLAEADEWSDARGIDDPDLVDLTALPFVPVDEPTSRDLDQALYIAARDEGGWVVWYALADAAYYVRPGSALFEEAQLRGASYYLPGQVVPMLPRVLSEDVISLNAGVDRRAVVFQMPVDAEGHALGLTVHRARIHCRHKLNYDGVQAMLDGQAVDWDPDVVASLRRLVGLGEARIRRADERGVVRYRRTEVEVRLDPAHTARIIAIDATRNAVEKYNEQVSLLANSLGAEALADAAGTGVDPIYRVHDAPDDERLGEFAKLAATVADERNDPQYRWDPDAEPLVDYLERLPVGSLAKALHRQAMILNRPSHYDSSPGIHHGVGARVYARFTAPMREIVGIFVHRELLDVLAGTPTDDTELAATVQRSANRSRDIQRKIDRACNRQVLDDLLAAQPGPHAGTILGITKTRIHVQLHDPRIDLKVYVPHLEERSRQTFEVSATRVRTRDWTVRLGDRVWVEALADDRHRDRWRLDLTPMET